MAQALPKQQRLHRQGRLIQMPNTPSPSESVEQPHDSSTLLSMTLIVFESLLTFLLRHDATSQRLAEQLVARQAVIRIRTHLPAYTFYATFSHHGVLLDEQAPEAAPLATVDGSVPTLFRAFMSARPAALESILIHGDELLVTELRQLMTAFNIGHIFSHWFSLPWSKKSNAKSTADTHKQQRLKPLLKRIDEQKKQIDQLNHTVQEQADALAQLRSQHRLLIWSATILAVLLLVTLFSALLGG